jgi:hypothetical protein
MVQSYTPLFTPYPLTAKFGPYGGQFVPETLMPPWRSWNRLTGRSAQTLLFKPGMRSCCAPTSGGLPRLATPAA